MAKLCYCAAFQHKNSHD